MILTENIELLRDLYESDSEIDSYVFHKKYNLSPASLARVLNKYEQEEIIEIKGSKLKITEKGRNWVFANRRLLFLSVRKQYWKVIYGKNEDMQQYALRMNDTYLIDLKSIDIEISNNMKRNGKED